MNQEDLKIFQTVCFLAVMQHGEGLASKAPKYIQEKMKASEDPRGAWNMLDLDNQILVRAWARYFGFPLVDCMREISKGVVTS